MKHKRLVIFGTAFAFAYIGLYLALTSAGSYRPATWGLNGIKSFAWSPKYFTNATGSLRRVWAYTFLPLYWLDLHYWHNDWTGENGPRDETLHR